MDFPTPLGPSSATVVPGSTLNITGEAGNDPRSYRVDFSRAREELGFEATWSIPDGARQLAAEGRADEYITGLEALYGLEVAVPEASDAAQEPPAEQSPSDAPRPRAVG